mmetsp:Transcript_69670/g.194756  ORF Transcript_69670/g.194756 Transcript_69670/m.194756 type:complete len:310 (-) Transcript_69670:72-1001(-)
MGKRRQRLSDDRGLVLELVDKGRDVLHNDTGRTRRRVVHLHHLDARREVHAQRGGVDGLDLLFLGLHDVGQLGVPRLVQTKVRRHHQRGAHLDHLGPVVRLTLGGDAAVRERELGGHGGLRPAEHGGEHGTSLRTVAVDRLLAEQNDIRCLLLDDLLQQLRHGKRLELLVQTHVGGHVDAAVSTHGESRPDLLLRVLRADRHGHDLRRGLSLLHADRLLHGDLAEGVHRHLHVRELDALFIGRDAHLDGIVDDPLDSDENLHLQRRWRRRRCVRRGLARRGGGVRWCQRHRPGRPADGRTLDGGAVMCH